MPTLTVDIPEQTLTHLAMELSGFAGLMKLMTAMKMYELGSLDSREAATLAGLPRGEFLEQLRAYHVPPFTRVDPTGTPVPPVTVMTDAEVLRLARLQMPSWQSRRLHELLDQQREGPLSSVDAAELTTLCQLNDHAVLLKAEALAEAVQRGLITPGHPA
jgi:hypothetical protein